MEKEETKTEVEKRSYRALFISDVHLGSKGCQYLGTQFGDVLIEDQIIHETADNRRFLVIHGDQYDVVVRHHKWLAVLGDRAYVFAIKVNTILNKIRRKLGLSYWSLSAWAKMKVKSAVNFVGEFEKALCVEADRNEVDGVICGHIHHAVLMRKMRLLTM